MKAFTSKNILKIAMLCKKLETWCVRKSMSTFFKGFNLRFGWPHAYNKTAHQAKNAAQYFISRSFSIDGLFQTFFTSQLLLSVILSSTFSFLSHTLHWCIILYLHRFDFCYLKCSQFYLSFGSFLFLKQVLSLLLTNYFASFDTISQLFLVIF